MKPDRVCTIVMACAVLHNIAVERREPEPEAEEDELIEMEMSILVEQKVMVSQSETI
jgi:hypothetical protein